MSEKRHRKRPAPEITRGAFPVLSTFLRGYLHEDWQLDYETARDARQEFLEDATRAEREAFLAECEIFHARTAQLSFAELREVLAGALGSAWEPDDADDVREVLRVP